MQHLLPRWFIVQDDTLRGVCDVGGTRLVLTSRDDGDSLWDHTPSERKAQGYGSNFAIAFFQQDNTLKTTA
jgi:hypothetical protein